MKKDSAIDMLAKAGVGAYLASAANGTLGQIDPDDMFEMSAAMASAPETLAESLGNDRVLGKIVPREKVQANILGSYYDAMFESDLGRAGDELAGVQMDMVMRRHDAANAYSGLSDDDIARIEFDLENGDKSASVAVMERFYLG